MTDLTHNWKFYVHNLMFGNWTEGEDAGGATYMGNLKGDPAQISLLPTIRANADAPVGTDITLSYAFVSGTPSADYINDVEVIKNYGSYVDEPMVPELRVAARAVFDEISGFANVTFVEAKEGEQANINIFQTVGGAGQATPLTGPNNSTYLMIGIRPAESDTLGEVSSDFTLDTWQHTFRHELGHVLGLSHPVDYHSDPNWPDTVYDPTSDTIAPGEGTKQFTVMSYFEHEMFSDKHLDHTFSLKYGTEGEYSKESYGLFDIKALQLLYGANTSPSSGNDTYSFRAENASTYTVYDSGGVDTFDLSNQTNGALISLDEASFSSVGLVYTEDGSEVLFQNNIAIAWDTIIENVIGSSERDIITGNAENNRLQGEGGDDRLKGGPGNDTLIGGAGVDRIHGGSGNDAIWAGAGDKSGDVIGGHDGNDTVAGGAGDDRIWGDDPGGTEFDGNDMLYGGEGDDIIKGGGMNDTIYGGAGDDVIDPGWGDDLLYGGEGADFFSIKPFGGTKTITDFDTEVDKLELLGFGIAELSDLASIDTQNGKDGILLSLNDTTSVFLVGLEIAEITNDIATF